MRQCVSHSVLPFAEHQEVITVITHSPWHLCNVVSIQRGGFSAQSSASTPSLDSDYHRFDATDSVDSAMSLLNLLEKVR